MAKTVKYYVLHMSFLFALLAVLPSHALKLGCEEFLTHKQTASVLKMMREEREVKIFTRVTGQKVKAVVLLAVDPDWFKHAPSGKFMRRQFKFMGRATRAPSRLDDQLDQALNGMTSGLQRLMARLTVAGIKAIAIFNPRWFNRFDDTKLSQAAMSQFLANFIASSATTRVRILATLKMAVDEKAMITLSLVQRSFQFSPGVLLERIAWTEEKLAEKEESYRQLDHLTDFEQGAKQPFLGWSSAKWPYLFQSAHVDARNRSVGQNLIEALRLSDQDQILIVTLPERFERLADQLERDGFDLLPVDYKNVDLDHPMRVEGL